jgi:carboxymethylenebutenolidase
MRRSSWAVTLLLAVAFAAPGAAQSHQHDYSAEMSREHRGDQPVASPAARTAPAAPVVTEEVTYGTVDGKPVRGFLARPAKAAKQLPAVIVVHEWWGLNDNVRAMAKRIAGEGYTALAVDLFNGQVATTPDSAGKLYQAAMERIPAGERNLSAALAYLKSHGATRIGSVGWCFGGHWSLRTGLVGGREVAAVVAYYGPPITDAKELGRMQAPLLGLYGGKDQGIPVDSVRAMERQLKSLGKTVEIKIYPEASHAFANPSGKAYDAAAADDAWQRTVAFFQAHLK